MYAFIECVFCVQSKDFRFSAWLCYTLSWCCCFLSKKRYSHQLLQSTTLYNEDLVAGVSCGSECLAVLDPFCVKPGWSSCRLLVLVREDSNEQYILQVVNYVPLAVHGHGSLGGTHGCRGFCLCLHVYLQICDTDQYYHIN